VAIIPDEMGLVFEPDSRQLMEPDTEEQDIVLLAAVAAGPANSAIDETWAAGYVSVHWSPAGDTVEPDKLRFRLTVPPDTVDTEERLRVPACANKTGHIDKISVIALSHELWCILPRVIVLRIQYSVSPADQSLLMFLRTLTMACRKVQRWLDVPKVLFLTRGTKFW
jgi:hypothetical protein